MRNFIVNVNGTTYQIGVEEIDGTAAQKAAPAPAPAPAAAPAPAPKPAAGGNSVSSPMPGNILAVNFKAGDKVKSGDTVMILEAMKMENEILAPADGTIREVYVQKGATVETGTPLFAMN
ncbi:MAG: biotin/lipoyl-binding protein [Clostridia bacterium]|nr:biotin/lipoyl-binding protein [Clostridia bacterium]MBR0445370.1 biotin/lipoyl-binding protein [Clostridia bacterium]